MGISVLERISQNIGTTLASLTTQSGYLLTITRAPWKLEPNHLTGYIFQLPPTDITNPSTMTDEWKQAYAVVVYVILNEDDLTPVDVYNNDIAATIYTALKADYTRGGLAIDTIIQPTLYFPPISGEASGITMLFDVHYRTKIDQPYVGLS